MTTLASGTPDAVAPGSPRVYTGPLQLRLDYRAPSPEEVAETRYDRACAQAARLQEALDVARLEMVAASRLWVEARYGGAR